MKRYPIFEVKVKGNERAAVNAAASRGIPAIFIEERWGGLYSILAVTADHEPRLLLWATEPALNFYDKGLAEGTCIDIRIPGDEGRDIIREVAA